MKTRRISLSVCLTLGLAYSLALGAQPDRRFDGVWAGTETVMKVEGRAFSAKSDPFAENRKAKIIIAQNGTLLAISDGFCPGRYPEVAHSGNTLVFHARNKQGSWGSELTLSADGNTLTERGGIPASVQMFAGGREDAFSPKGPVFYTGRNAKITGVFHRQK